MSVATLVKPARSYSAPVRKAVQQVAASGIEECGAIFTRREVVEFILDLAGYTADRPLYTYRLLEPSFGEGDFLLVMLERLLQSRKCHKSSSDPLALAAPIRAVEIHHSSFEATAEKVIRLLCDDGIERKDAITLAGHWLVRGDFLLYGEEKHFDFVIGNPPYVRQERIPDARMTEYRARYKTIYDRADLYIPLLKARCHVLLKEEPLALSVLIAG